MEIDSSRFGKLDVREADVIQFPRGIIGFPEERKFVLVPHGTSNLIGWLQSTRNAELAFPVVSAHGLVDEYPDVDLVEAAGKVGIGGSVEELAILAVLSAPAQQPATVNLLAPLVVNASTRMGAQVFLEGSKFSMQEIFAVPNAARQSALPQTAPTTPTTP